VRRPGAFAFASGLVALLVAAFLALLLLAPSWVALADNLSMIAAPLAAACAGWWAASRTKGRTRVGWRFLSLALASWSAGQATWSFYELVLHREVPFPSLADLGYVAFIPLALFALLAFADPIPAGLRARSVLDGLIIATATFIMSWSFVLRAVLEAGGESVLAQVLALTYPAGDIVIATMIFFLAGRSQREGRAHWWLMGVGLLALSVADSGFALLTATGAYQTGSLIDGAWLAGFLVVGLAGVRAGLRGAPDAIAQVRTTPAAVLLPYVPVAVAIVFVSAKQSRDGTLGTLLFWSVLALVMLVILRQLLTLLENMDLARVTEGAYARLREQQDARTALLNVVSHDLKSPLTPIRLQSFLLRKIDDPRAQKAAEVIERNVAQVDRLVGDVADLAKIESGKLKIERKPTSLAGILDPAAESFFEVARERGIALELRVSDGAALLDVDAGRLTQVVFNLVTNALKFTPRGGKVTIESRAEGGEATIAVRDTGRGLTPQEIARLFQPFSQVHASHETSEKGTGLGLFISRAIVEQHGGRMWVESDGPKLGSRFALALPLAALSARPAAPRA